MLLDSKYSCFICAIGYFQRLQQFLQKIFVDEKSPPLVMREGLGVGVWGYLTSTTRYLLVDQKSCGLVMRSTYCLLTSGVRV